MLKIKLQTALALGFTNLAQVFWYRLGVKTGLNPVRRLQASISAGDFFTEPERRVAADLPGNRAWLGQQSSFGWLVRPLAGPPNWHQNCVTGAEVPEPQRPWWQIADFDPEVGDIKTVWEASRFDWVLALMQQALHGDAAALPTLNLWLSDWLTHNPCYLGPNWKCGQEASIRVMHLAMALVLARQEKTVTPALQQLIAAHLQRIAPTLLYALAQDNNHGTSEAIALYIGGSLLAQYGHPKAARWQRLGLKHLEGRALRLIGSDGVFSQYSVTYHRLMLDSYAMAEIWRQRLALAAFSPAVSERLAKATDWLYQMIAGTEGDAPNWGANDGARLLALTNTDYRDFRPSVALAAALFLKKTVFADNLAARAQLQWLEVGIDSPATAMTATAMDESHGPALHCDTGGLMLLRRHAVFALLRYPRFRFRPSQSDALHLDVWLNGRNLVRDGGSYTYNTSAELVNYFSGVQSHSTVQFDDRNQMPKLSRFLFGAWLRPAQQPTLVNSDTAVTAKAGYTDWLGASHQRQVVLGQTLTVTDTVDGFTHCAVLRWRLAPGEWLLEGNQCHSADGTVRIIVHAPQAAISLTTGLESRYYLQKTAIPVLEIRLTMPGTVSTEFEFS